MIKPINRREFVGIVDCRTVERQSHHIYTYTYLYTYLIYNLSVPVHRQKPLSHSLSTGIGTIHTTRFHFHAILNEERNGNAFFSSPCYVRNELILKTESASRANWS